MAGKKRVRMRGVKHTSKRLEEDLLEKSRTLADNPGILRPQCAGNCRKCVFDKPFKQIDSLQKVKNNPDALIKEASRFGGDDLVRAYAGTISLAAAGSVPMLASGKLGGETVSYAVRGTVAAPKLIGCQYYDDPRKRMLLYGDVVKKNKLHLYSFGDDIVCSDAPKMPEDYLYDTFWETPYEFPNDGLSCGHETSAILEIHIKSLNETISICEDCAKNISTLMFIISRLAAENPTDDIVVRIKHKFHAENDSGVEEITGDRLKEYMIGKITDATLISSVKRSKLGSLKDGGSSTYIIGTRNYGSDLSSFISDLTGDERELKTLERFLSENARTLVMKSNKVSEALATLWDMDWKDIVSTHTDKATAEKIGDRSKSNPSETLTDAHHIYLSADVVAALPEFRKPGPFTQLADRLAKAAKVGGSSMVIETASKLSLKDNKSRAMVAAFMIATGVEPTVKLTREESETATYLSTFAKNLIAADGQKYADSMKTLLTASGTNEKLS